MIKPGIVASAKPEQFFRGLGIEKNEHIDYLLDFLLFDRKVYLVIGLVVGLIVGRAI